VSQYQKKHSITHTYPDHQSSFISFLHLLQSIASSLFSVQFTCLMDFFAYPLSKSAGLSLCMAPSTSYSMHFFIQSLSSFCDLSNCSTDFDEIWQCEASQTSGPHTHTNATYFAVVPKLCHLILVFTWNSIFYLNITHPSDHSHEHNPLP